MIWLRSVFGLICLMAFGVVAGSERMLVKEVTVTASLDEIWHAWTTAEGLTFISQEPKALPGTADAVSEQPDIVLVLPLSARTISAR